MVAQLFDATYHPLGVKRHPELTPQFFMSPDSWELRTEPARRVERARIILGYLAEPSAYAVAGAVGVTPQTVGRCLGRAAELGVIEALDDRPRAGRDPVVTPEAKTWLVALACRKPKELGYPHEL
jgi:hypothetical protein